jgi:hypothetical protein
MGSGLHQSLGDGPILWFLSFRLSALSDDAQAVVVEVSEAVSTALDEFHFAVEAFGDAIVFGEAPHAGDFLLPAFEGIGQGDDWSEAALGELLNDLDEARSEGSALVRFLVAHSHQRADALHLVIDRA